MHASTTQIEKHIIFVEKTNEELTHQTQQLCQDLATVSDDQDQQHEFCVKAKSILKDVSGKLIEFWPTFWQDSPQLPNDVSLVVPMQHIELIFLKLQS
jgi:hypothetical protein